MYIKKLLWSITDDLNLLGEKSESYDGEKMCSDLCQEQKVNVKTYGIEPLYGETEMARGRVIS